MAKTESNLTIQLFHQCYELISIKLNTSNFLLSKFQILPLFELWEWSRPPEEHIRSSKEDTTVNPQVSTQTSPLESGCGGGDESTERKSYMDLVTPRTNIVRSK